MKNPRYSIIVPNFNGKQFLNPCLESIISCEQSKKLAEIIVVDNGSTDKSCEYITENFPEVRIVTLSKNTGFTGAISAGTQVAKGEILIFLNNDMRVSKQWLSAYEEYFENSTNVCATGLILNWDGDIIDFYKGILLFDGHALQTNQGTRLSQIKLPGQENTFIACGGNMAVKAKTFMSIGGFDNNFFAYTEDVDFSWRLYASGHNIAFLPDAKVFHHHNGTSSRLGIYKRGFLYERNAFLNIYKNIDEAYFEKILHATLITLLNRTKEIININSSASSILDMVPFTEDFKTTIKKLDSIENISSNLFIRGFNFAKKHGTIYTIGKIISQIGDALQRIAKKTTQKDSLGIEKPYLLNIGHPHIVSQLQVIWYIINNMEHIYNKRKEVQLLRTVPDKEIFQLFPPFVVTTYPGDEKLFSSRWFWEILPNDITFRFASISEIHGTR